MSEVVTLCRCRVMSMRRFRLVTCMGTWVPSGLHSGIGIVSVRNQIQRFIYFYFCFHYSKLRLNKGHRSPDVSIFYFDNELVANHLGNINDNLANGVHVSVFNRQLFRPPGGFQPPQGGAGGAVGRTLSLILIHLDIVTL